MTPRKTSLEQALEEAVSRALRDNLAPLQRTADELHHAYGDLVAACGSSRPSNALPALLRAQTAAAALAAGLSVLSNFVAVALNPREQNSSEEREAAGSSSVAVAEPEAEPEAETAREIGRASVEVEEAEEVEEAPAPAAVQAPPEPELEWVEEPEEVLNAVPETVATPPAAPPPAEEVVEEAAEEAAEEAFDLGSLPREEQELHRRANRVAKVAMQDIKLLQPKEVRLGRERKDLCVRLRVDIDKARKEYDRRFRAIQDHPVDYFYDWMVEILADGDPKALGEYPYPSPVLRH